MTAKDNLIRIRCSDKERATLQAAADARGLSLSAYVRMVALEAASRKKLTVEQWVSGRLKKAADAADAAIALEQAKKELRK